MGNITYDVSATSRELTSIGLRVKSSGISTGHPSPLPTAKPTLVPSSFPTTSPQPTISAVPTIGSGVDEEDINAASVVMGIGIGLLFAIGVGLSIYLYMKKKEKHMKAKVLRSRHNNKFTDDNQFVFSNENFEEKKPKKVMLEQNQEQYGEEETKEEPGFARLGAIDRLKPFNIFRPGRITTTPGGTKKTVGGGDFTSMATLGGVSLSDGKAIINEDDSDTEGEREQSNAIRNNAKILGRSGLPPPPPGIRRSTEATVRSNRAAISLTQASRQTSDSLEVKEDDDKNHPMSATDVVSTQVTESSERIIITDTTGDQSPDTSMVSSITASPSRKLPRGMMAPAMPPPPGLSRGPSSRSPFAAADSALSSVAERSRSTIGTSSQIRIIRGGERNPPGVGGPRGPRSLPSVSIKGPQGARGPRGYPLPSATAAEDGGVPSTAVQNAAEANLTDPAVLSSETGVSPSTVSKSGSTKGTRSSIRKKDDGSWIAERRIDINGDGDPLTKEEFLARYGGSTTEWESSPIKR